jgi:hypothetical protein
MGAGVAVGSGVGMMALQLAEDEKRAGAAAAPSVAHSVAEPRAGRSLRGFAAK